MKQIPCANGTVVIAQEPINTYPDHECAYTIDYETGRAVCIICRDPLRLTNPRQQGFTADEKRETTTLIHYITGHEPTEQGTYAVRIDEHGMLQDKFLQRFNGMWFYPLSDQQFRAPVLGWVGPLSRGLRVTVQPRDEQGKFK
jgi:hypothetical protein